MMLVYISGAITGLSEEEYTDNFAKAEAYLVDQGHHVINPLKVAPCHDEDCNGDATKSDGSYLHNWKCYMRYDLIALLDCDAIFMLLNYHESAGATLELHVAERIGMEVMYQQHEGVDA